MRRFKSISQFIKEYKASSKGSSGSALETTLYSPEEGKSEIFIIKNVDKIIDSSSPNPFVILTVSSTSVLEEKYVEITGTWLDDTKFSKGAIITIEQDFHLFTHLPYIDNKPTAVINDASGAINLYPHYLILVRSIASSCRCLRKGYLFESIYHDSVSEMSVLSSLMQMCAVKFVKALGTKTMKTIIEEVINENRNIVYIAGENETTIKNKLRKKLSGLPKENAKMPDFVVPNDTRSSIPTHMFPKLVSSKEMNIHQSYKSFKMGLSSSPSSILETADGKLMPLVIVGRNYDEKSFDEQMAIASGNIQLFNERYEERAANAGFIWYITTETDNRFFVKPNIHQLKTLNNRRNAVVGCIAENRIPPREFTAECDNCVLKKECSLYSRMEVQRINAGEFSRRTKESDFFWHFHDLLSVEALAEMECCTNISMTTIEKRVQQRKAIQHLKVRTFNRETGTIILDYEGPLSVYAYHIRNHDSLIFTSNGSFPIIGSGIVTEINYKTITAAAKDIHFDEGQEVTADMFVWSGAHRMKAAALCQIFIKKGENNRLKELLIEGAKPRFAARPLEFNDAGLNLKQKEAVSFALRAKDYALIHAPPGSGIIHVISRIIAAHVKAGHKVLVAPYFYKTINKLIEILSRLSIKFIISGMPDFISEDYKKYCDSSIFSNAVDIEECDSIMNGAQVYIVQSKRRSKLIDQISFDVSIIMDASIDDVLLVVPQIIVADSFILTGDPSLDDSNDSAFNQFARHSPESVVKLTEIYDTEQAIIEASRLVWGNDLISFADHAIVELDPLSMLPENLQTLMKPILSMDSPIVFVDVREPLSVIFISLCSGLVYERVVFGCGEHYMPQFMHAIKICDEYKKMSDPPIPLYIIDAMTKVFPLRLHALRNQRNDVGVYYADGQTDPLKIALAMTKRKVILLANVHQIRTSPLWTTTINRLQKHAVFSFKNVVIPEPFASFKSTFDDIK